LNRFPSLSDLPRAHGGPAGSARIRATPDDFAVREWLGFEPDGEGDHLLLRVRKRDANTLWVAKQLARLGKLHPRDVGFAGLKDRDAVAEQAFTVPARSALGLDWVGRHAEGFEVVAATRQRRKLKRGALRGNDFELVLRDFDGDVAIVEQRLQRLSQAGAPNYFGPQRFGRAGHNLDVARAWLSGEAPEPERSQRAFALSAARSAIFNAVLAERVLAGTWNELCDGDVANLDGSGSIFDVPSVDDTLMERCRTLDIHPTGPMWGAGAGERVGATAVIEREVAQRFATVSDGLLRYGLEAERRALRMAVSRLAWTWRDRDLSLQFRLGRGSYATAVLHELIDNAFAGGAPESDDS
jgi:tRNA pseudouridine13 synthase